MKMTKVLRPLMKCPKCGHRKRVDLKYDCDTLNEWIHLVCAICGHELKTVPTLDNKEQRYSTNT